MEETTAPAPTPDPPLKRAIGTRMLTVFVIGDVLGAGIYALVGKVSVETGGAIWSGFVAALVLAVLTAFAYAELVTKYPRAAGAALYVNRAFRRPLLTFIVAFAVMCSGLASASTLARAFAGDYLLEFVTINLDVAALAFILVVAAINLRGISESVRVNLALTAVEVIGLLIIVVIGVDALLQGQGDFSRNFEFDDSQSLVFAIVGGAAVAFYALIGFEDAVNVAEETRDPTRAFPRALFTGLAVAGAIYLLVTLAASTVVETSIFQKENSTLLEVVREGPLGIDTKVFSFIALLAVANGALINMVMASRLVYGMSRQGIVPRVFASVLPGRRTPHLAIAFTTLVAAGLILTGDLSTLSDTTVVLLLMVFTLVNVAVLVLRSEDVGHEHFHAPIWAPVLGGIVSIFLLVDKASDDLSQFGRAALLLVLGLVLYGVSRLVTGPAPDVDAEELAA